MPEDISVLTRAASPPDEVLTYGPEPDNVVDVRYPVARDDDQPEPPRPLVFLIHGGFWRPQYDRMHLGPLAVALASEGWTVANVEYRRVPHHPNIVVGDVELALKTVPEKISGHDGRVIVMGHSAGGHLTLWAASRRPTPRMHGALALAPAVDLRLAHAENLGSGAALAFVGEDPVNRPDLDPVRMAAPAIGTTIVHGERDHTVPIAIAESYVSTFPQTRMVRLPDVGHFAVIDPLNAVWAGVVEEIERLADG